MTQALAGTYLALSLITLAWQASALRRLQRAGAPVNSRRGLAYRGMRRTLVSRVIAAVIYVALATGVLISGSLPVAALLVYAGVQAIWLGNSWLDLRLQRRLGVLKVEE